MNEILEYITSLENGANEALLSSKFPNITKLELATSLNALIQSNQIEVQQVEGVIFYSAIKNKTMDYEALILNILSTSSNTGVWLKDIKSKTNIPHNLLLKILKNLENDLQIKSIKCVKSNRKLYVLYDTIVDEGITGGIWFTNNEVDTVFTEKMMDIIYKFVYKKEDAYTLVKIDGLVRIGDVLDFIGRSGISDVQMTIEDISVLIDAMVYDGRIEKIIVDDGIALRALQINDLI